MVMDKDLLSQYKVFVDGVTSDQSKDVNALIELIIQMEKDGENMPRFLTAGIGLASESGEIAEIVKKVVFQGKPLNDDTKFHIKRDLGDDMWYVAQMCLALDMDIDEVILENINKLESRYPGGFSIERSEKRIEGDL